MINHVIRKIVSSNSSLSYDQGEISWEFLHTISEHNG